MAKSTIDLEKYTQKDFSEAFKELDNLGQIVNNDIFAFAARLHEQIDELIEAAITKRKYVEH